MALHFEFEIRERTIEGEQGHTYEAVHLASELGPSKSIALPNGGAGKYLGWYPEIEEYLAEIFNIPLGIQYRGDPDTLSIDYKTAQFTWTYLRTPATVVIKDIPRILTRA